MKHSIHFGWGFALALLALLLASGCTANNVVQSTSDFPKNTGFTKHYITIDGHPHSVWVFVPRDYKASDHYPAVLFLHGLFEAGSGQQCLAGGLAPVIAKHPGKWPFITIFPQSDGTWRGEARDHLAIAALDFAQQNWSIDSNRIILAGLSYGGLGAWQIGANHPDRFAAIVPVSGFSDKQIIKRLAKTPVWAFDFQGDPFVSSQNSEQMCEQIKSLGGSAKITEFDGVGHDCCDRAIAESDLVNWMLQQRRSPANTSIATVQ
jgi:predicted peptidase